MNVIKSFLIFVVSGTGRGKKATGRPPAEPEDRSYSELNEEGMREYNKLKKQEQRSRDNPFRIFKKIWWTFSKILSKNQNSS